VSQARPFEAESPARSAPLLAADIEPPRRRRLRALALPRVPSPEDMGSPRGRRVRRDDQRARQGVSRKRHCVRVPRAVRLGLSARFPRGGPGGAPAAGGAARGTCDALGWRQRRHPEGRPPPQLAARRRAGVRLAAPGDARGCPWPAHRSSARPDTSARRPARAVVRHRASPALGGGSAPSRSESSATSSVRSTRAPMVTGWCRRPSRSTSPG